MNSTDNSLKRIYSHLAGVLERPLPMRHGAKYLPLIPGDFTDVLPMEDGLDSSALLSVILQDPASKQYQKCLSQLTAGLILN